MASKKREKVKPKKRQTKKEAAEESKRRSRAARKGWKARRAKDAAEEERRGYEVTALALAIFRPVRGKHRDRWDGIPVLERCLVRIKKAFDTLEDEYPGFAGAFAPAFYRGSWRAEIPFKRSLTYDQVRIALDSVDGAGIDLNGGRLHIGLILKEHGYAPVSDAVGAFEMALANASDTLAQGVTKYAPVPSIEPADIEESVEAELEREEKAAARKRLAFKRGQEREKMMRRRVKR